MVMQTIQVRIPKGQIEYIDKQLKSGQYANRSDVIRDSLRRAERNENWISEITSNYKLPKKYGGKDSVEIVRGIRKELDKEILSGKLTLEEINSKKLD